MKILAIGTDAANVARELFGEGDIDSTPLLPGKKRSGYDALLSYMALPKVSYRQADAHMSAWLEALKPGGEIVIFVPSLEWAARQIFTTPRSPAFLPHLFGVQDKAGEGYMSGYTLLDLRSICFRAGLAVTHASTGEYMINDIVCECHSVRGVKK
jgi:hypothetical protein